MQNLLRKAKIVEEHFNWNTLVHDIYVLLTLKWANYIKNLIWLLLKSFCQFLRIHFHPFYHVSVLVLETHCFPLFFKSNC